MEKLYKKPPIPFNVVEKGIDAKLQYRVGSNSFKRASL